MIEIQCTSCHTRYRIDERVLPDDTPTFKCSRCGHVFNADPVPARARKMAPQAPESESQAPRTIRPARPRASALKSPVESDVVKRDSGGEARQPAAPKPEARVQRPEPPAQRFEPAQPREESAQTTPPAPAKKPEERIEKPRIEPEADEPLNRTFGDRDH